MIDVIVPLHYRNAVQAAMYTLPAIADSTDVPIRFIIAGRGGASDDWEIIRTFLDSLRDEEGLHYGLLATEAAVGNSWQAVNGVLDLIKHDYVFIMRSNIRLKDKLWFGKMNSPIMIAPYVGGVFLPPVFQGSATLDPNPINEPTRIYESPAFLTTRAHIEMTRPMPNGNSFCSEFQARLVAQGATRWSHPGVNFEVMNESASWASR